MGRKKLLALLIAWTAVSAAACAPAQIPERLLTQRTPILADVPSDAVTAEAPSQWEDSNALYALVCDNPATALYADIQNGAIAVLDKRGGDCWRSAVDVDAIDTQATNNLWLNYMKSILSIRAVKTTDKQPQVQRYDSGADDAVCLVAQSGESLTFTVTFGRTGITVIMEVALENDRLEVYIPADSIRENGEYQLISAEPLPFFGASSSAGADGYILIPDGSGALMHFQPEARRTNVQSYYFPVYSPHETAIDSLLNRSVYPAATLPLPVYGLKSGGNAFLGYITQGEADAELAVTPESAAVAVNRAAFQFKYRYSYNLLSSNISLSDDNSMKASANAAGSLTIRFDATMQRSDRRLTFVFLQGDGADYSGMANAYRNHLVQTDRINLAPVRRPSVSLEFFCGVLEPSLFLDSYIRMTGFEEAGDILDDLSKSGLFGADVVLNGWAKNGYGVYPSEMTPDNRLGGKSKLVALNEKTTAQQGLLFLKTSPMLYDTTRGGFISRSKVLMLKNGIPASGRGDELQVFNMKEAQKRLLGARSTLSGLDGAGLSLSHTDMVFNDYNSKNPLTRTEAAALWRDAADALNRSFDMLADSGNLYMLSGAAGLSDIPTGSTGLPIEDEDVPFYQMVVSGYLPYTAEAGNYAADVNERVLKWAEYGCVPHFEITAEETRLLKKTIYNRLFTSHYDKWRDTILETEQRFRPLTAVAGQSLVSHTRLGASLYKSTYQDGTTVYVNYADTPAAAEGLTVPEKDFIVRAGGTQE